MHMTDLAPVLSATSSRDCIWIMSGLSSQLGGTPRRVPAVLGPVNGMTSPKGEALDYATPRVERASAPARPLQALGLLDQGPGVAHLELARRLDVERLDHTVLDEHRVALRAHTHAAPGEIERETGGPGEVGAAVGHHPDLARGLLVTRPGAHHERVVDRHAPDLVDAGRLQWVGLLDVARHVLGRAGRRERPWQAEDRDRLARGRLLDVERVRAERT